VILPSGARKWKQFWVTFMVNALRSSICFVCMGRFYPGKNRLVLVKLHSLWNKRIILSNCRVLKNYSKRGIFIVGDEPVEVGRQQTMDRLKYRAERANKIVAVSNGFLSIDGVVVFSLKDGYPTTSNG